MELPILSEAVASTGAVKGGNGTASAHGASQSIAGLFAELLAHLQATLVNGETALPEVADGADAVLDETAEGVLDETAEEAAVDVTAEGAEAGDALPPGIAMVLARLTQEAGVSPETVSASIGSASPNGKAYGLAIAQLVGSHAQGAVADVAVDAASVPPGGALPPGASTPAGTAETADDALTQQTAKALTGLVDEQVTTTREGIVASLARAVSKTDGESNSTSGQDVSKSEPYRAATAASLTKEDSLASLLGAKGEGKEAQPIVGTASPKVGDQATTQFLGAALESRVNEVQDAVLGLAKPQTGTDAKIDGVSGSVLRDGVGADGSTLRAEKLPDGAARAPIVTLKTVGQHTIRSVQYLLGRGEETLTVRLVPQSLGELHIAVRSAGDSVDVVLMAANASVRETLEHQIQGLRDALAREGIEVGRVSVSTSADTSSGAPFGRHLAGSDGNAGATSGSSVGYGQAESKGEQLTPLHARQHHDGALNLFV